MSGWEAFEQAVRQARAEIARSAPDRETATEGEAYVMRVAAAALAEASLGHLFLDGGLSRALPTKGGPNPDYAIASAPIDPGRRYRLEGQLHASERVSIGLYALGATGAPVEVGYAAFDARHVGPEGRFSLDLRAGADEPGSLAIPPDCRILIVRTLHRGAGQRAVVSLAGGAPPAGLALATGTSAGALDRVAKSISNGVGEYLKWTRAVAAKPNRFDVPPPELAATVQGDRDTHYYLGYYQLEAGEWLEVTLPGDRPGYWSLHVYNHWFESLHQNGAHDRNTELDEDGQLRVRIGPAVPAGLANRVETLGRRRGGLICRIIGATTVSVPETRVLRGG